MKALSTLTHLALVMLLGCRAAPARTEAVAARGSSEGGEVTNAISLPPDTRLVRLDGIEAAVPADWSLMDSDTLLDDPDQGSFERRAYSGADPRRFIMFTAGRHPSRHGSDPRRALAQWEAEMPSVMPDGSSLIFKRSCGARACQGVVEARPAEGLPVRVMRRYWAVGEELFELTCMCQGACDVVCHMPDPPPNATPVAPR